MRLVACLVLILGCLTPLGVLAESAPGLLAMPPLDSLESQAKESVSISLDSSLLATAAQRADEQGNAHCWGNFGVMLEAVRATQGPEVLAGMGAFAGMFDASKVKEMRQPALVASTDGVGTKLKLAGEKGARPALAFSFAVQLPNASNESGLGTDQTEFYSKLLLTKHLGKMAFRGNLGLAILGSPVQPNSQADLLTALKSGDRTHMIRALRDLSMKSPENPDPEVAQTLERLLLDQDDAFMRKDAAKALERTITDSSVKPGDALKDAANQAQEALEHVR